MTASTKPPPDPVDSHRSPLATIARLACAAAEPCYTAVVSTRNAFFNRGWRKPQPLGLPTVSVGNITTGGTGKTPMVIDLARRLLAAGRRPAVLLRGYRHHHTPSDSDEAALLRDQLGPAVPVEPDPNRVAAAKRTRQQHPGVNVLILDDGFQHRQAHRDLDLVLIDATNPFDNRHVLPRGHLREPLSSLRRAHAVIVTRADQTTPQELARLDDAIRSIIGDPPIAHVQHRWDHFVDHTGSTHPLDSLADASVVAVSGIGNPRAFERSLQTHTRKITAVHTFPDHHHYTPNQLQPILTDAHRQNALAVVTTQKDFVKWRPLLKTITPPCPIYYPTLSIAFIDGEPQWNAILKQKIS